MSCPRRRKGLRPCSILLRVGRVTRYPGNTRSRKSKQISPRRVLDGMAKLLLVGLLLAVPYFALCDWRDDAWAARQEARRAREEAHRVAMEARRDASEAQREARRAMEEARREIREAEREARRAMREARREVRW